MGHMTGIALAARSSVILYLARVGGGYRTNATAVDEALKQQAGRVSVSRDEVLSRLDRVADARMVMNCVTRLQAPYGPLVLALVGQYDSQLFARTMAAAMGFAGNRQAEESIIGWLSPDGFKPGRPPEIRKEIVDRLDDMLAVADAAICERYPETR